MPKRTKSILLFLILVGCTTTVINYPSVCPNNDQKCQRNLDAQTLSTIGQDKAALKLMCLDTDLSASLGNDCLR